MKRKQNLFLWGSVAVAIVVGALVSYGYRSMTATVPVVVAADRIAMDSPVEVKTLKTSDVPVSFADEMGAITDPAALAGRYLSVSVVPGQPITKNMLSTAQDMQSALNQYAKESGQSGVLMQIPMTTALDFLVKPSQDIALHIAGKGEPTVIKPVHVLAVQIPPKDSNAKGTLFVFVRHDQFKTVANAVAANQARVALYTADDPKAQTPGSSGPSNPASNESKGEVK